jgi:hypothetical protein
MKWIMNDGGRAAAGFKGTARDCVTRSIAILTQRPYLDVYREISDGAARQRQTRGRKPVRSARNGIFVQRKWFKDYMMAQGFEWTPCMGIGTGCRVHLVDGELPMGRLAVSVSKHLTAVIDGEIHDTHDPQREVHATSYQGGVATHTIQRRCVYGYWTLSRSLS